MVGLRAGWVRMRDDDDDGVTINVSAGIGVRVMHGVTTMSMYDRRCWDGCRVRVGVCVCQGYVRVGLCWYAV